MTSGRRRWLPLWAAPLVVAACSDPPAAPPPSWVDAGDRDDAVAADATAPDAVAEAAEDGPTDAPPDAPDSPACADSPDAVDLGDPLADQRLRCTFAAGARVADTLGVTPEERARIPLTHVIVVTQENRSFDHLLGALPAVDRRDVDGIPPGYTNPDRAGRPVAPHHLATTCLGFDPPHQWDAMHTAWDLGRMDGFYAAADGMGTNAHLVLGFYDEHDLPFYRWMYRTFAMSDRCFGATLGGTWANRDFMYAGSSYGVRNTGERELPGARTVFDALDDARVAWGVYTDGTPRQNSLGWTRAHAGVAGTAAFFAGLRQGTLPPVSFVDPAGGVDEHPPGDLQRGEAWMREIVTAAAASPLWPGLAVVFTYDESGGFFDHVPPPPACPPSPDQTAFDRLGVRVPLAVISPYARPGYVSHRVHSHTSVLRLIELLHDLPALTARDANSDALLDLFDFACPHLLRLPTTPPAAGTLGCVH